MAPRRGYFTATDAEKESVTKKPNLPLPAAATKLAVACQAV
jgi:hypothetical protein